MRYLPAAFLFLLLGFNRPAKAVEAIVSHAQFRMGDGSPYIELAWQINPTSLHYKKDSLGRLTCRLHTSIRVSADTGDVYFEQYYLNTQPFDPRQTEAPVTLENTRIDLAPGTYKLELILTEDAHPQLKFTYRDPVSIAPLTGPEFSSIQLLDTFFASKEPGPFQKRGMQQLPKVFPFFDEGQFRLTAYAECYPTSALNAELYPLRRTIYISHNKGQRDLAGHIVHDSIRNFTAISVTRQTFDLSDLPSGNYHVNLLLRTAQGDILAEKALFFQTLNRNPRQETDSAKETAVAVEKAEGQFLDLSKTFVGKFDAAQLRAILKMMLPTAQPAEVLSIKGFLERPDDMYIRYFIYNHFNNINKADPARAWKEFADKIREVNKLFKVGSTMGYETDRGVVYLRYGEPAEILRVPNEGGSKPYEIWRYNVGGKIGGSGLFLFYSPGFMASDFRLLHSTVPGERNNPNWRGELYGIGQANGTTRAEEYFGK